jgi:cytochrome P450
MTHPDQDPDPLYNPLSAVTLLDPYPVYASLRATDPVYWHEQMDSWVVTRYDDCRTVLADHRSFARDERRVGAKIPDDKLSVQQLDPPDLVPLRRAFVGAFGAVDLTEVKRRARLLIEERLDELRRNPSFDLMVDLARPVAEDVICSTFGACPPPETGHLTQIALGVALSMDSGLRPSQKLAGRGGSLQLDTMVRTWLANPDATGFMGHVAKNIMSLGYPDTLIYRTVDAVVNAAYSTLYASIGNAALVLMQHPEVRAQFTEDNLTDGCHELVRFDSPAHATSRVATERTQLGTKTIDKGQCVITLFAAANRDPERFPMPDQLILDRASNAHLGFGFGVHQCLGIDRAYGVLQEFVAALLDRPVLRLAGQPVRYPTATLRWLEKLPATFATNSAASGN